MSYTNYPTTYLRNKLVIAPGARMDALDGPALWNPTAVQNHALGRILELDDGTNRAFVYLENGSNEIIKAGMTQSEAIDAQCLDSLQDTGGVVAKNSKKFDIQIDTGNALNDGDLAGGWMIVNQGALGGDCYFIKDNNWTTSDTLINIEIADQGGLRNAIAAADNISFIKNRFKDVIVKPTTLTAKMLGVTLSIVPADYFFWAQWRGPTAVIIDTGDDIVVGEPVGHIDGSGTAGSVGLVSTHATDVVVGQCIYDAAGADFGLVNLTNMG